MTLSDLRAILERAEPGSCFDVTDEGDREQYRAADWLCDIGAIRSERYLRNRADGVLGGGVHVSGLDDLGRDLLAALRAAERVPVLQRERDEALAAAKELAGSLVDVERACERCHVEEPSKECCVETALDKAYRKTGGTPPPANGGEPDADQ
jgi:hypothetical protein